MEMFKTYIMNYRFYHSKFVGNKKNHFTAGFLSPRIAYIRKGWCKVTTSKGELLLREGTTWYLPRLHPYVSYWSADFETDFYTVEFEANNFSSRFMEMQAIDDLAVGDAFEKMNAAIAKNDEFAALSALYNVLAEVKPHLKETQTNIPESILHSVDYITANYKADFHVADLAKQCFLSESRFYYLFKKSTGFSPVDFKNYLKINYAVNDLLLGKTLEEICEEYSFCSPSYFRRLLKKYTGYSPSTFKKEYKKL